MAKKNTKSQITKDLETIASHISETLYYHSIKIGSGPQYIRHDDYDRLREIAKFLRGPDGQIAHEFGRESLPW